MIRKLLTIPLYVKILLGMFAGMAFGFIFNLCGFDAGIIKDWIEPFGAIFMRLLKLIAVPLVFTSLILGVGGLGNLSSLSKIGIKTLLIYLTTTLLSIVIGVLLVFSIKPGGLVNETTKKQLYSLYSNNVLSQIDKSSTAISHQSPLQSLVEIIPENFLSAATSNSNMLQVISFALLLGIAILMLPKDKTRPFMHLLSSFNTIILKVIDLIMSFSPIGVFALMCSMVVTNAGEGSLLTALGLYAITVILGLAIVTFAVYPLAIKLFTRIPLPKFFKEIWPVQLLAFSTSSSAATLPLAFKQSEALGISNKVANFVLPVGTTINMAGTSLYQAIAAIFIAQVMSIELTLVQIITIILTATVSSIGTPGVPGGSLVMLMMVLSAVGIPSEGLILILGIDRPLDMLRTIANVTGDVVTSAMVDKK
ncbi:MAG: dicarboxylate/amino acid:cation symporter [Bacteroidales bacterium]